MLRNLKIYSCFECTFRFLLLQGHDGNRTHKSLRSFAFKATYLANEDMPKRLRKVKTMITILQVRCILGKVRSFSVFKGS